MSQAEVDAVANWRYVYGAVDALELDSGDYEHWAQRELANGDSPVNRQAFEVVRILARRRAAYFNFRQGDRSYETCPIGDDELTPLGGNPNVAVCERHRVAVLT